MEILKTAIIMPKVRFSPDGKTVKSGVGTTFLEAA
jgi:hypothetical protein